MKQEIKHDSWHMWLANIGMDSYCKLKPGETIDICQYIRLVAFGIIKAMFCTFVTILFVSWVLFSIGNLIGWLFLDYAIDPMAAIVWITFGVLGGAGIISYVIILYARYEKKRYWAMFYQEGGIVPEVRPSFISLAYRKFKEKTCFKLEVK
jgi:lipid-A-disaccharide synthase-like uncharacterized protein